ncbi:MAG: hypothetical protein ACKOXK_06455 [Chakrabartia sp.]
MTKKILALMIGLALSTPALADRGRYGGYSSGYGHHHGSRTAGTIAAILGGVILGAALASNGQRTQRSAPNAGYATPATPYDNGYDAPDCSDREVTEQTVSGRYVTYTETVCR